MPEKFLLIALAFIFLCSNLFGQNCQSDWLVRADSLYNLGKHEEALKALYPVKARFEKDGNWECYVHCVIKMGDNLDEMDSTKAAAKLMAGAFQILSKHGWGQSQSAAKMLMWQGSYELWSAQYNAALEHLEAANALFEQGGVLGDDDWVQSYKNASQIYLRRLDYPAALRCYDAAIRVDTSGYFLPVIYLNKGTALYFLKQFDEALECYDKGLKERPDESDQALLECNLADCLKEKGQYEQAQKLFRKSINWFEKSKENNEALVIAYTSIADLALRQKNYSAAENWFQKAHRLAGRIYIDKNREVAKLWVAHGSYSEQRQQDERALNCYQQAIIQVFPYFNDHNWTITPKEEAAYVESFGMTAPAKKAELLLKLSTKQSGEQRLRYLKAAADAFDLAFAGMRLLNNAYNDDIAKLYLGNYVHTYLEHALEVRYQLFNETHESIHVERFFRLLEQNKARILSESLRKNHALENAGIPDSLLRREDRLRRDLADTYAELFEEKLKESKADPEKLNRIQARIGEIKEAYARLIKALAANPVFNRITQTVNPITTDAVHRKLGGHTAFMEFFEGDSAIYFICISARGQAVYRLDKKHGISESLQQLFGFLSRKEAIEKDANRFFDLGYLLFRQLCPDLDHVSKLIIVPDGLISSLPFESLLTAPGWRGGFANAPFLIRQVNIRYAWSAELWIRPYANLEKTASGRPVHFAPVFPNRERGLTTLAYSDREVEDSAFSSFTRADATAARFLDLSGETYSILHISTHAVAGEEPGIEFYDRRLLLPEMYAMRLKTGLFVLSACETGQGRIERGEGVMSFARGCAFAGASSLIASLWQVNEHSTQQIFHFFYRDLFARNTRADALRSAKVAYLDSDIPDAHKSPYYWSAFVFYGADGFSGQPRPWGIILLSACLFLGLAGFVWYKRRKAKRESDSIPG